MKKKIGFVLLAILVGIQFINTEKDITIYNPSDDFFDHHEASAEVKKTISRACYDCHSNTGVKPWYGKVAPISWFINNHINEGREAINFSGWGTYDAEERELIIEECIEEIEEKEMPLKPYTMLHRDLSTEERDMVITWLESLNNKPEVEENTLHLNNGEKWKADSVTIVSIQKMIETAKQEVEEGRLSHYAAKGEKLSIELRTLLEESKMTNEAHEQLNLFLLPLVNKYKSLEYALNEDQAMKLQWDILEHLQNFDNYFESN